MYHKYEKNMEKKGKGLVDVAYGVDLVRGVDLDESREVEGCYGLSRNMAVGSQRDDGASMLQNGVATLREIRHCLPTRQRFTARRPDTRMDMARWCYCLFHRGWSGQWP
jgi:hypothetical protein